MKTFRVVCRIGLALYFIFTISSCGGSDNSRNDSEHSNNSGGIVFGVNWIDTIHGQPKEDQSQKRDHLTKSLDDCMSDDGEIVTVKAIISADDISDMSQEWDCSRHEGTISEVPAGLNRKIAIYGLGTNEEVLFRGEKDQITVTAGETEDAGRIDAIRFEPTPIQAGIRPTYTLTETIELSWNAVSGAQYYQLQISYDETFNNDSIIINIISPVIMTNLYRLNGSLLEGVYYWHVKSVDNHDAQSHWTPSQAFEVVNESTMECGNGIVNIESGELCDIAIASGQVGACPTSCITTDPCRPQILAGTGCRVSCITGSEPPNCHCGNGTPDPLEECDLGVESNDGSYGGCNSDCSLAPYCSDEIISGTAETCDDGNTENGDGCNSTCGLEANWSCSGEPSVCSPLTDQLFEVAATDFDQFDHQVITASDGNIIVVWGHGSLGSVIEYHAQKLDRLNRPMWGENSVLVYDVPLQVYELNITPDDNGGLFLAWSNNPGTGSTHISVQHISGNGDRVWDTEINMAGADTSGSGTHTRSPACIATPDNGVIVAWGDQNNAGITIQKIDSSGNLRLGATGRQITVGNVDFMGVCLDATPDRSVIYASWKEYDDTPPAARHIRVMRLNSNGDLQWPIGGIRVSDPAISYENEKSHVTVLSGSNLMVAWEDTLDAQGQFANIYGQMVNSLGERIWENDLGIETGGYVIQYYDRLRAVPDEQNGMIISWEDSRFDPTATHEGRIFAQRVSSAGTHLWMQGGVAVTQNSTTQRYHDLASDNAGGAYLVWSDTIGYDPYAQHILQDQSLAWGAEGLLLNDSGNNLQVVLDSTERPTFFWHSIYSGTDEDVRGLKVWTMP